ncbi:DUF3164 family protein [Gluconobacter morbifer]|uniref:Sulfate transporter n=1 Tax=Gluconobacter morbifer G707 TaxID=1088869 RepID=G6XIW4_9PROT|nr:DUF3164 family protein [Gluconobacter morbifer]EHH68394.1 hypothetical protein GMO_11640 [Gluconobacter morbifer G707]
MSNVPDGFMEDAAGRLVPVANVRPEDLLQDELVRGLVAKACGLREQMVSFRRDGMIEIQSFLDLLAEKYGAKRGGSKGNVSLKTYDGRLRVLVAIGDFITFGPELQIAKDLIDSCLTRWSEGANQNIKAIVLDAFDVGKEGRLNTTKILGLRRYSIEDEEWMRAMDAITASVRIDSTRSYLRFYERPEGSESYQQIPLELAKA